MTAHYAFYHALDTGGRVPSTPAQEHFVAVCRGIAIPETDHERAYMRFKRAVADGGLDEAAVVAAGFVLSPEPAGDNAEDAGGLAEIPVRPCVGCGRLIPPERLRAIPRATRCVTCQDEVESAPSNWHVSDVECPRCASRGIKSRLVWRMARDPEIPGYFLGCGRFPECRYTRDS